MLQFERVSSKNHVDSSASLAMLRISLQETVLSISVQVRTEFIKIIPKRTPSISLGIELILASFAAPLTCRHISTLKGARCKFWIFFVLCFLMCFPCFVDMFLSFCYIFLSIFNIFFDFVVFSFQFAMHFAKFRVAVSRISRVSSILRYFLSFLQILFHKF